MPDVDRLPSLNRALLVGPQVADPILWRTPGVEDEVLADGLPGVARIVTTLDGRDAVPWIGFERPSLGLSAQVLGTPGLCLVELGVADRHRMLARADAPDPRMHRLTPTCQYWVRAVRGDEAFTTFEAAAHIVLWLQQQIVVPALELRTVYDHGGRRER